MSQTIRLGISTCPNDTFTFHALMERKVDWRGLEFHVELMDVEELNTRLFAGDFDVAKASFHAALLLADKLGVLPTGSALGYGVGPLLLAARDATHPRDMVVNPDGTLRPSRILCPGEHTTATLLYRMFHRGEGELQQAVFFEIMPALQAATADFGVCIHEGRFTWREQGLALVEDLGTVWEQATAAPLPLGGILARHRLGAETLERVQRVLRDSLDYALAHRDEALVTMRRYAQEFSDDVLFAHVDLYVNEWTQELGSVGRDALTQLADQAAAAGIVPTGLRRLEIVGQ